LSIDTVQKRQSVWMIPGIMPKPFPKGVILQPDRQQTSDVYAGILTAMPPASNQTCWVLETGAVVTWNSTTSVSSVWVNEFQTTVPPAWVREDPVVPCTD
jgi:hypothetical protein